MVCDSHLAQDVAQSVFVALAHNAARLSHHPVLSGWLHRTTLNIAAQTVRTDVRRRHREQEVVAMNESPSAEPDVSWDPISPYLDAALDELSEPDRDAVLLRYFEKKSAQEMGVLLGISGEAAQKRVSRAVERLREFLTKRGVSVGASGLVLTISAHAVQAAPAALTPSTVAASLAATVGATGGAASIWNAISVTKLKVAVPVAGALVIVAVLMVQNEKLGRLQKENTLLRASQVVAASAPVTTSVPDVQEVEQLRREHLELLRLRGEVGRLRREIAGIKANVSIPATNEVSNDPAQEQSPKQITVTARFVTGSKGELTKLGLHEASTAIFDEDQTGNLFELIKESDSLGLTSEMQVTTPSGRQVQISSGDSVTNSEGVKVAGPVLDLLPRLQADGKTIELSWLARGGDPAYINVGNEGTLRLPVISPTNQFASAIVWDGQTLAVTQQIEGKPLLILISPRLIDAAGNPIHAEIERPIAEAKSN